MKRAVLLLVVAGVASSPGWVAAADPVYEVFKAQLNVQERLAQQQLEQMQQHQASLEEAWSRVDRLTSDLVRAHQEHESLESIRLRGEDLQQAEADLAMRLLEGQQLRLAASEQRALVDQLRGEVQRLEEAHGRTRDPLSGTWQLVVEPGGQEGVLYLSLDGTLVSGTYALSGGWSGSMRGTLVAGKVRLERVDAQMGFSAVFYGRLSTTGDHARLEGTWEGTNLAAGMPSAGTWVARKRGDETGPPAGD